MSNQKQHPPRGYEAAITPCLRCKGTGHEVTALEDWEHNEYLLKALAWPELRIRQFKNSLRKGDIIWQLRALSVETQGPDGRRRTFFKIPGTKVA